MHRLSRFVAAALLLPAAAAAQSQTRPVVIRASTCSMERAASCMMSRSSSRARRSSGSIRIRPKPPTICAA